MMDAEGDVRRTVLGDAYLWTTTVNGQHVKVVLRDESLILHAEGIITDSHIGGRLVDQHGVIHAVSYRAQ